MKASYDASYKRIVRSSAVFDILVMLPFAIPGVIGWYLNFLRFVHKALSFSGTIPEFAPTHLLFTNLLGAIVLFWSVVRIYRPDTFIVRADIVARFVFSFLMIFYYLKYNITGIVGFLVATELLWAVLQMYALKKIKP